MFNLKLDISANAFKHSPTPPPATEALPGDYLFRGLGNNEHISVYVTKVMTLNCNVDSIYIVNLCGQLSYSIEDALPLIKGYSSNMWTCGQRK